MRFGAARSLALIAGSRPLSGNANESPPAAASVLGPWLLLQRSLAGHPELVVHPVDGGDVLGTVLPILEQALRFAAGATVAGGAR